MTDYTAPRMGPPLWWGRGPDGWPMLVVPLGGMAQGEIEVPYQQAGRMPPVVRILEASTGRKLHTIDGLSWPKLADLDGDGLEDLWGSVEGKLRAFRGGPPEAWRSLDELVPVADLDGDGLADALALKLHSAAGFEKVKLDNRTAVARSGRDGRVLWTRKLDDGEGSLNWETWFGARPRIDWTLSTFPLHRGDLDGDGSPEVIVTGETSWARSPGTPALPIEVFSGRSGRRLWKAGPLPSRQYNTLASSFVEGIDVCVDDATGIADLLAVHTTRREPQQTHLTRLSGATGGSSGYPPGNAHVGNPPSHGLRASVRRPRRRRRPRSGPAVLCVVRPGSPTIGGPVITSTELRAVSLRDGKTLWTHPLRDQWATFAVGDLDHDGRAEVVIGDQPPGGTQTAVEIAALDGRDGAARWAWRGGDAGVQHINIGRLYLADFDGKSRHDVGFDFGPAAGRRVMILDGQGPSGRVANRRGSEGRSRPAPTSTATAATSCSSRATIGSPPAVATSRNCGPGRIASGSSRCSRRTRDDRRR